MPLASSNAKSERTGESERAQVPLPPCGLCQSRRAFWPRRTDGRSVLGVPLPLVSCVYSSVMGHKLQISLFLVLLILFFFWVVSEFSAVWRNTMNDSSSSPSLHWTTCFDKRWVNIYFTVLTIRFFFKSIIVKIQFRVVRHCCYTFWPTTCTMFLCECVCMWAPCVPQNPTRPPVDSWQPRNNRRKWKSLALFYASELLRPCLFVC